MNPHEKKNSNIQDLSIYTELKNEHKKIKKPRRCNKQKKRLSRKEFQNLGLNALPRKSLKYEDYVPLNQLWNSYFEQQLPDPKSLPARFEPSHPQYDQISMLIHKSDYHGSILTVSHSKCASLVGQKGIIIKDTKGTFSIISKDNVLRVIPKSDSIFELSWKGLKFTIFGKHICYRSADRSTKKIKSLALIDL